MKKLGVAALVSILSLVIAASAHASFVQGADNGARSARSIEVSFPASVKPGDTLVGIFRAAGSASVSDTVDGSWTEAANDSRSGGVQSLWYFTAAKGGPTTVTLKGAAGVMRMVVDEYSGARSLDAAGCQDGTTYTASTPSLSAAASGELAYAGVGTYARQSVLANGLAVLRTSFQNRVGTSAGADIVSLPGNRISMSFLLGGAPTGGWAACGAVFKSPTASTSGPADPVAHLGASRTVGAALAAAALGPGALLFDGSFKSSPCGIGRCAGAGSNWPTVYGSCYSILGPTEAEFKIPSSGSGVDGCNTESSNGGPRTDLSTPGAADESRRGVYTAGVPVCTTVPVDFPDGSPPPVNNGSTWLLFAELVDPTNSNQDDLAGWGMGVSAFWTNNRYNQWNIGVIGPKTDGSRRSYWVGPRVTSGWHTLSICTNDASSGDASKGKDGKVYSVWFDGVRRRFSHGPCARSWSCNGFPLIQNDPANEGPTASWPLDIDDYTGGSVPNTLAAGDPLVAVKGWTGLPPEPPGGWNSP